MSSSRCIRGVKAFAAVAGLGIAVCASTPAAADIVTVDQMIRGISMTAAECKVIPNTVWLTTRLRGYCIRYYLSTVGGVTPDATVFLQGDRLGSLPASNAWKLTSPLRDIDTDDLQKTADSLSKQMAGTAIYLGRVGLEGSSGDHRIRHSVLELDLTHVALDAIKRRHGFERYHLIGQSGGSRIIGGLLARRNDIGCAVIGSGRLSEKARRPRAGLGVPVEYYNVADQVGVIATKTATRIILVTDPTDKAVPERTQTDFVLKLRRAGGKAEQYYVAARDDKHHGVVAYARLAARDCSRQAPPDRISAHLQAFEKTYLMANDPKAAREKKVTSAASGG